MRFGKLDIDPASNPAILDTATWDPAAAWQRIAALPEATWTAVDEAAGAGRGLPALPNVALYSPARYSGSAYLLAGLPDGQQVFLRVGPAAGPEPLGPASAQRDLPGDKVLAMYPTVAGVIDAFFRYVDPSRAPRALGPIPRLGIGTRMTTLVWPGIWQAMLQTGCAANAIQNSVRELNLLDQLLAGQPPERNIAFNFGAIESGYTGSTFEGLWVAGVLDALRAARFPAAGYGADADHIQVKRGAAGLERALRLVDGSRYYTFYTLDVSDVLDYAALAETSAAAVTDRFESKVPNARERRALLDDYAQARRLGGQEYRLDNLTVARLAVKYWDALAAVEQLAGHIASLKGGVRFDLELSIDEHPGEVPTVACLTGEEELLFVLSEVRRRHIPLTHVAPNYGVEKGVDYSCPDGLPGLQQRAVRLGQISSEFGLMADFHSGDDLSQATRRAIGRATHGRLHFKVSPMLQLLFGEVLADYHPELFCRWWEDARAYARREAQAGSSFAAACLAASGDGDAGSAARPSAHDAIFHNYSFAFVGRRDAEGQFLQRHEFYQLSPACRAAYAARITRYVAELAADLF